MTIIEAKAKTVNLIKNQSTENLKEAAQALMNNTAANVDFAFDNILNELSERMPIAEFIEFTDNL